MKVHGTWTRLVAQDLTRQRLRALTLMQARARAASSELVEVRGTRFHLGSNRMIEHLLEPNSTELPQCTCGNEMNLARTERKSDDTALKIFACAACTREMRLMVWSTVPTATGADR